LNVLSESADCVFPLDNKALTEICDRISQQITKASSTYKDSTLKWKGVTTDKKMDPLALKNREASIQHTIVDSFTKQNASLLQRNYPGEFKTRSFDYMNNIVSQMLLNLTR